MEKPNSILLINVDSRVAADCRQILQSSQLAFHSCTPAELRDQGLYRRPWRLALAAAGRQSTAELGALLQQWPVIPTLIALNGCHHAADTAAANGQGHLRFCTVATDDIEASLQSLLRDYDGDYPSLVAHDPLSRGVTKLADRVAATNATVLLTGESGVGKEVYARRIHQRSERAQGPFVAINCAAIPESMLEAQLFGHEKGAFTGAHSTRSGTFESANHGTLLLDEISEMDLSLQAKLLRVLQENELARVGGNRNISLDVRVLATSNRDLVREVEQGRFRQDLFYRLSVFPLAIPPLAQRRADILPLAYYLLARQSRDQPRRQFAPNALEALIEYHWPGNVRELSNVIQRVLILSSAQVIDGDTVINALMPGPWATSEERCPNKLAPALRHTESELILEALQSGDGNRQRAAEQLGISPRTLRYKIARMRKAGIAVPG